MKVLRLLLFLSFILWGLNLFAQDENSFSNRVSASIEKQLPVEKVYLHLDRFNYNFNDTVWYKAYTVVGQHHQLSALSGVLYVELISPSDTLITRQVLKLTSGVAWNAIPLLSTLKQGIYHIRAYTRWMRKAGMEYFYNQRIRIGGLMPSQANVSAVNKPDVQFFPEGGDLVAGLRSRVAIKAINSQGAGEDIKGTIEDNDGNVITDIATEHLGMGVFAITPQTGKTYRAKINIKDEAAYSVPLPLAQEKGLTLAVNNSATDSIYFKVTANDAFFKERVNSGFCVIAQSAGKVYYNAAATLKSNVFGAAIAKSRFPSGIVQFTLFNQNAEPVAERITFIRGGDSVSLQLSNNAITYKTRQQVTISLSVTDNDKPIPGSFSAAVISEIPADADAGGTIISNLLLTSDLRGYIEQPAYYFSNNSAKLRADMDLLMLTQGYRRFSWDKEISGDLKIKLYEAEKTLAINGLLTTASGAVISNGNINLISARENFAADTIADAAGKFRFTDIDLPDTARLVLRARKGSNGNNVNIYIQQPGYAPIIKSAPSYTYITNALSNTSPVATSLVKAANEYQRLQVQDSTKNGILLKQVTVRARKIEPPAAANRYGAATPDFKITGKRLGPGNLSQGLQANLPFILYKNGKFYSLKPPHLQYHLVIDGREAEFDELTAYTAADIEDVKMAGLIGGSNFEKLLYSVQDTREVSGGLIIITTRRYAGTGGPPPNKLKIITMPDSNQYLTTINQSGLISYTFKGYAVTKEFYRPKYNSPLTAFKTPDYRATAYWNPNIVTGANGSASFSFFTNDTKGIYQLIVEGIDDDGRLGRQLYRFRVE